MCANVNPRALTGSGVFVNTFVNTWVFPVRVFEGRIRFQLWYSRVEYVVNLSIRVSIHEYV